MVSRGLVIPVGQRLLRRSQFLHGVADFHFAAEFVRIVFLHVVGVFAEPAFYAALDFEVYLLVAIAEGLQLLELLYFDKLF